ncbi:MAG: hypothetical protein J6Y32_00110 [Bacteroidales bacterium]|nr:hypothetical protein [Bacteroidales bacterium]
MKKDILEYVEEFGEITNSVVRGHLNLPDSSRMEVSRLLSELVQEGKLRIITAPENKNRKYANADDNA